MGWSIRKGCVHCQAPLNSFGERVLRTCKLCAKGSREGFSKMGEGKFKEGYKDVQNVMFGKNIEKKKVLDELVSNAVNKKEDKIRKKLKKKGLSEQEIEEGLEEFKKVKG